MPARSKIEVITIERGTNITGDKAAPGKIDAVSFPGFFIINAPAIEKNFLSSENRKLARSFHNQQ
jgi:hypothetical protein